MRTCRSAMCMVVLRRNRRLRDAAGDRAVQIAVMSIIGVVALSLVLYVLFKTLIVLLLVAIGLAAVLLPMVMGRGGD